MIDQNTSTRWASKNVDASKPLEITLNFSEKETLDQMNFDLFVSKNNGIGAFDIDHCIREDGTLNDTADTVLSIFPTAYVENLHPGKD